METLTVTGILEHAEKLTKSPEKYLSVQEDVASEIRNLTKKLYDFNKHNEPPSKSNVQTLEELVLENLDEEQIWQQIELQNNFICQEYLSDIAQLLVKKHKLSLNSDKVDKKKNEGSGEDAEEDDSDEHNSEVKDDFDDDAIENFDEFGDSDEVGSEQLDGESGDEIEENKDRGKEKERSIVDDKFFKLSDMEKYLDKVENKKDESDEEEIDYFENYSSESEEDKGYHYNDFFDQPDDENVKRKRKKSDSGSGKYINSSSKKKKVQFSLGDDNLSDSQENDGSLFNDGDSGESDSEDEGSSNAKKDKNTISTFEARQERLKSRIRALEEEALKEKPWQMKGEVSGSSRPQNSLLEEYVEFDAAVRPPPVITEKSTLKLEDIIKQRIKDKAWDDVERKIKPVEDPKEYKKRLVLDQEKSKLSLAQIYEQEYLKQKEEKSQAPEDRPEVTPDEHVEIDKMMKSLFSKLDALSNFHFTPKMVTTEVKVISNLPAVTMEEVAPVATSDAALLAPEEIKPKMKGDLIGKTERTKTDKNRERRIKKKKQRIKQKHMENKQKAKLKAEEKVKDYTKKSKQVSKKLMKKLGHNVKQSKESGDGKYIRSSNAFFSKLQDEIKSHIKTKASDLKKLSKDKKLDAKKLKL